MILFLKKSYYKIVYTYDPTKIGICIEQMTGSLYADKNDYF